MDEVEEFEPVGGVAFFDAEGDGSGGDVAVEEVVDLSSVEVKALEEPGVIPA